MAVYIGYNYAGKVISIVNAKNQDLANAYWQGADIIPHSVRCLDDETEFTPLDEHPTGVYPILTTVELEQYEVRDMKFGTKILAIK